MYIYDYIIFDLYCVDYFYYFDKNKLYLAKTIFTYVNAA